jgi:hypothetical protein
LNDLLDMSELVHVCAHTVKGADGVDYGARVYAEPGGTGWIGWLEFVPERGGVPLRTQRETSQPTREAVAYWALGLEAVYLEGALQRAAGQA